MTNKLSTRPVSEFLPHRAPMILIDSIVEHYHDHLIASVTIHQQSPFFEPQLAHVPNYVGIEYMAQTIAALAGVEADARGEPIRTGFLLGSRKLKFACRGFDVAKRYHISVSRLYQEDSGLAVFECSISDAESNIVASANVNVFQPQNTDAYLAGALSL